MRSFQTIIIAFIALCISQNIFGQTANVTSGCAELKVNFTAPSANSYFWDFGDGSTSDLQNPVHSYVQSGDFVVKLFDMQNGTQVGNDIDITVYPPIEVTIDADVREGCAPLNVNFTSQINAHPDLQIKDIVWTFGDGNSASGQNTNFTYNQEGIYSVSIKVLTENNIKCDEPILFQNYIKIEGPKTSFRVNENTACFAPAEFTFTNTTRDRQLYTFLWEFGDGNSSTEEGPVSHTFQNTGLYEITLTATSNEGCVTSNTRKVNIGSPKIEVEFEDTLCAGAPVRLFNTTIADSFYWDFTNTSIDFTASNFNPFLKSPEVTFLNSGNQTLTLSAFINGGCETKESFNVHVEKPNVNFSMGPDITCAKEVDINFSAEDKTHALYTFYPDINNESNFISSESPEGTIVHTQIERDEYYINYRDSIISKLIIESANGCTDSLEQLFYLQRAEAFFVPDVVKGCVPFDVTFEDKSFSEANIVSRSWDFGDGTTQAFGNSDTLITHTFTTPGIHEVRLRVDDDEGCTDLSRPIQVLALLKDTVETELGRCNLGDGLITLCIGDSATFTFFTDQNINSLHTETDGGRFDHCWREQEATHTFLTPGLYPVYFTQEVYGIYIDSIQSSVIFDVVGTKADIDYRIECNNPFQVNFNSDKSYNADNFTWYIDDQMISQSASLSHTFPTTGDYKIFLETEDTETGCIHVDSTIVHIRDIQANISLPENVCAGIPSLLDASKSIDVRNSCVSGYKWEFLDHRPREVAEDSLLHVFGPGQHTIQLTVEDINGCTDTATAEFSTYEVNAIFETDTLICLPFELEMDNSSRADTTIASYMWQFGAGTSEEENPLYTFTQADLEAAEGDSIVVELLVTDVIGCINTSEVIIDIYEIPSRIFIDEIVICQEEAIEFTGQEFTGGGSSLDFLWQFENIGDLNGQQVEMSFPNAGIQNVSLIYTEKSTGCMGQIDTFITVMANPIADWSTDYDDLEFICFPEQIEFFNESIVNDDVLYDWTFGNGANSDLEDPLIAFDKGTFEVELIVRTFSGCLDTMKRSYTLVGPEGEFIIDKDDICPGEDFTVNLENAIDVSNFTWDFGDGTQVDNQNQVTHTYDPNSAITSFTPTLILRSDNNGCEQIINLPINISSITADFIDSIGVCPGEVTFFSDFVNPESIRWDVDGQVIESNSNPSVTINSASDSILVSLYVRDNKGCEVEREKRIANPDLAQNQLQYPNAFSPNNDPINPYFNVIFDDAGSGKEINIVNFKVFNRWGEVIYDNDSPSTGWNGSYEGEFVPPDVYAYFIEIGIEGCNNKIKKGNVTVIK